jgi:hypothetical protein
MLSREHIDELRELANRRDQVEWRIGEIAKAEWDKNVREGRGHHRFQIFTAVAREARCSKGRVEKLYSMVRFFTPEVRQAYPDYKLGHYEIAMNFGKEGAPEVLEYIQVYAEDKGELPKVSNLDFLYRREVLGQETEEEIGSSPTQPYDPDMLENRISSLIVSIRSLAEKKPLPDTARVKFEKGLELIREALIDIKDVVSYT